MYPLCWALPPSQLGSTHDQLGYAYRRKAKVFLSKAPSSNHSGLPLFLRPCMCCSSSLLGFPGTRACMSAWFLPWRTEASQMILLTEAEMHTCSGPAA